MDFQTTLDRLCTRLTTHSQKRRDDASTHPGHTASWSWAAHRLLSLLAEYPSGVTPAIINSELEVAWDDIRGDAQRGGLSKKFKGVEALRDGQAVSTEALFELVVGGVKVLPGTRTFVLSFVGAEAGGGHGRFSEVNMYLHQKYCFLEDADGESFFTKRTVRLTGTRSVTAPNGATQMLPTEYMLFILDGDADRTFVSKTFGAALNQATASQIEDANEPAAFLVKVTKIEPVRAANSNGRLKRMEVLVTDTTTEDVPLVLWDQQIGLASLFRKGDWLGIWRPYVTYGGSTQDGERPTLEYGSQTVIFRIAGSHTKESDFGASMATQAEPGRDEKGILDQSQLPSLLRIRDLKPKCVNATIMGRVAELFGNNPVRRGPGQQDRYGVRLEDSTDYCDITLWGDIARKHIGSLHTGDYVLFLNLATTARVLKPRDGGGMEKTFDVIGSSDLGTVVWNVSTLVGMISSPSMRRIVPIVDALNKDLQMFYVRAFLVECRASEGGPTISTHQTCGRVIEQPRTSDEQFYCAFCQARFEAKHAAYTLKFVLDDGTARCAVSVTDLIAADIVGVSSAEFLRLPENERKEVLESVPGQHVEGCVVKVPGKTYRHRLAAVVRVLPSIAKSLLAEYQLEQRKERP
ncbi:uncharacterized protein EV422DRAFT_569116 [Fimicolochytrium jonesii]|uniref:uncharacterized protein n=1 Tax=Fimicolochytrium jonesii TaxID=1396493 RepID=UPI0022FE4FCA|nr:uncharacterized protein EV422DRAFT_569116 [Fimicolochytrium jonesii]KAI8819242.1 hypothetical protein EV422DRAFT_569116 [Fimicolochytrium jonesii]